jgi:hypothetical protein
MVPRDGFDFVERWPRYVAGKIEDVMSGKSDSVEQIEVEQLRVGRHFKMKCDAGGLAIHASGNCLGVWLDSNKSGPMYGTIGMIAQSGMPPYFSVWPAKGYFERTPVAPFAFSAAGLQVPHPDGTVTILSLEDISAAVKAFKK